MGTDYYYDKNNMFTIAMTYKKYDHENEEKVFYYNPDYFFDQRNLIWELIWILNLGIIKICPKR
ncbi:MAG: hypothetical protein CM1200mP10_02390 [Candidatus Neomarinimicrobiota bacterium]|nr:MAG: hypothetical protein CM1200mP10_02390 [Candidatus Neomarinimicrobiota bacterium]